MRRLNSLFEILKFPLKVLLIAYIIMSTGMLLTSDNFAIFYTFRSPILLMIFELMIRVGAFVVLNFPLFVIIKLVSRKVNSSVPITSGIIGYVSYLVATLILASSTLPSTAFSNIFDISHLVLTSGEMHMPIQTGLIAAFIVGFCTRISYWQSRNRGVNNIVKGLDQDSLAIILNIIYCIIAGFIISLLWPYLYGIFDQIISFISSDITNPISLFIYGILDRVLSILNMSALLRIPFWFGTQGGSWVNLIGETFTGDVTIWQQFMKMNQVPQGFGRLISPYYVMNIFAIPGLLIGIYSLYTDKKERIKNIVTLIILVIFSVFTGILLPVELMLLFLSPLLLIIHIIFCGGMFSLLQIFEANLGFSFSSLKNVAIANPGTMFDYAIHFRDPLMQKTILTILAFGVASFVFYFFITRIFFKYLAVDIFQTGKVKEMSNKMIEALGGVGNIVKVDASIFHLTVEVKDHNSVHKEMLLRVSGSKISETKDNFIIVCGKNSIMYRDYIVKLLKKNKRAIIEVE